MNTEFSFLIFNGEPVRTDKLFLSSANRAFQYGDSIFETMHFFNDRILFIKDHLERLKKGLDYLHLNNPEGLTLSGLNEMVLHLAEMNGISSNARARLTVFRDEEGFYTPAGNHSSYIITVNSIKEKDFVLNETGLILGLSTRVILPLNHHENNKTGNSIPYIRAGIFARENNLDDCLLLNANYKIAEAVSSNVFIIKSGEIITPPLYDGCIAGVMRKQLISFLKSQSIFIQEKSLGTQDIINSDEIFLTNVMQGIRWVGMYEGKKKKNDTIKKLFELLMEDLKKSV